MKVLLFNIFILAQLVFVFGTVPLQNERWAWDPACSTAQMKNTIRDGLGSLLKKDDPVYTDSSFINFPELKFLMTKLYIYGLRKANIDRVSVDGEAKIIRIAFQTDFSVRSKYWATGSLFSKPFYGEGYFAMELYNTIMEITLPYRIINDINGNKYIELESFNYRYDVRAGATYDLTNLYYGNEVARQKMLRLMQKNFKILTTNFGPYVFDPTVSEIFADLRQYLLFRPLCK